MGAAHSACAELVPVLSICLNSHSWDPAKKRTIQYIPYEHYLIGWHPPDELGDAVEADVLGSRVFVPRATLRTLDGKRLIVATLDQDPSNHPGFQKELLVAVPLVDGLQSQKSTNRLRD